ncbi:MAG TPA: preprotein translocase subunit SecE [Candidatus Saccharimonadales bacterium]|nr:preprotein translocase subunit SecE [Candidatus Saccharimonadales bacterium]
MARSSGGKKPRIRKSAPTVREIAEAARSKEQADKPQRVRRYAAKLSSPAKRLKLAQRGPVKTAARPLKLLAKVLSWLVPKYFVNSWRELRLVHWPTRRETWRLTLAVFIFSIVFGALVAGVDKGLDELFKKVILK